MTRREIVGGVAFSLVGVGGGAVATFAEKLFSEQAELAFWLAVGTVVVALISVTFLFMTDRKRTEPPDPFAESTKRMRETLAKIPPGNYGVIISECNPVDGEGLTIGEAHIKGPGTNLFMTESSGVHIGKLTTLNTSRPTPALKPNKDPNDSK